MTLCCCLIVICNLASETKSELRAAVWRLPDDVDPSSPADDQSSSHSPLQLLCQLDSGDHDVKGWVPLSVQHSPSFKTTYQAEPHHPFVSLVVWVTLSAIACLCLLMHLYIISMEINWYGLILSICRIMWHPTGDTETVLGLSEDRILTWDLNVASSSATVSSEFE